VAIGGTIEDNCGLKSEKGQEEENKGDDNTRREGPTGEGAIDIPIMEGTAKQSLASERSKENQKGRKMVNPRGIKPLKLAI